MAIPGRVTIEIEEAKQELAVLLTRLDEKTAQERDLAREVDCAKQELAAVKTHHEQQKTAFQDALAKIQFLKLPDADTFSETFRGDVTFVVLASIPRIIHAHRLILVSGTIRFELEVMEPDTSSPLKLLYLSPPLNSSSLCSSMEHSTKFIIAFAW